jgi:acylglycerol lipase
VYSFDQRGWGRSVTTDSEKGLTGPTTTVLADITSFIKTLLPAPVPLFVMGHSMGGAEVLCYMAQGDADVIKNVRGWLFEAPFISFHAHTKPSVVTVFMGRLAGKVLPKRQMLFKLDEKTLSRDESVQKAFVEDDLCHDTGTLEGLASNLDRATGLETGKIRIPTDAGEGGKTRMWMSHGNQDGVCDCRGTNKVYNLLDGIDDKELKIYDGWFHKRKSLVVC